MHYLLFYAVDEDYVSRRAQFRELHLKKAWEASERGELVLAGPWPIRCRARCCCFKAVRLRSRRTLPGLIPTW